jgi:hypothetical protein
LLSLPAWETKITRDPLGQDRGAAMNARPAQDILGFEYDWLASDADGHVALFSTAGGGYAPASFLGDTESHGAAIEAILALPKSTETRFAPALAPDLENTWLMVAERGLFAFDSHADGGPYRMVAAPEAPIHVSRLPSSVASVVRSVPLPHRLCVDACYHEGSS